MRWLWKHLDHWLEQVVLIGLLLLLLLATWCIYDSWYVYSYRMPDDLTRYKPSAEAQEAQSLPFTEDYVAWITIDGTDLDYPVFQGTDNMQYLNTDPFGNYALSGSIFLDSRNAADFRDSYNLVYGHHMEYGRMFGALDAFLDPSYLEAHRTGTLTIGADAAVTDTIEVLAAVRTDAREAAVYDPGSADALRQWMRKQGISVQKPDPILGLSTCTDGAGSERLVLFCYQIHAENGGL